MNEIEEELLQLSFLQGVIKDEIKRREARKLASGLKRASFEEEKTFKGLDFSFNSRIRKKTIKDLSPCLFIEIK
ncbi:hypothetical protein SAMN04489760_1455 [Syntrophus gentianae]|uniref:IstB-like ATP-binding domain-containing protein n=1 Tax=Syntrophus gentianae TaxID=43775 RepID=A0A1H8B1K2_9BACT|nr:ATP-binding protein [Syntrophus gentianae]SEM76851.1 hypothetical protein SAMN04489760_1455 [Syntrophus gentianae]